MQDLGPHPDLEIEAREAFDARMRRAAVRGFRRRFPAYFLVVVLAYAAIVTLAWWTNWPASLIVVLWTAWIPFLLWRFYAVGQIRERVRRERLCFGCGRSLGDAPVTEYGLGRCADCGEPFNLRLYDPPP